MSVTLVVAVTAPTETGKVAVVDPAGTTTPAGTVTAALLLEIATVVATGAAAPSVTVPVSVAPSTTLETGRVRPDRLRGVTVSTADWTEFPEEPVIVALVTAVTGDVDTVNVAVVAPAAITTLGGTLAETLLLDSVTRSPPAGAAPFRVIVPAEVPPPRTLAGLSATVATPGDDTVRAVDCEDPAYVAVTVALMSTPTATVVTVKDALVSPVGTVTLTGSGTDDG